MPNCGCCSCHALIGSPVSAADRFSLPPPELTTTNLAPANSEVMHSRDVIRSAGGTVSVIQAMIDDLERRKAELLSLIRVHKAISSPLRTFPLELLATIFAEFITIGHYSYPRHSSPLLLLMSICSRWRRIVLDTPQLWTRIWGAPPAINSWIAQSRELPLHLEFELNPPNLYTVLEALVPHAHRWEHIHFSHVGLGSLLVLERVRARLHSLKTLRLHFGGAIGTVDFCEVAPQLTDVELTGIYEPIIIKLPWEQLRSCTLDNSELALDVLQRARNLRTCRLVMTYITVDNIGAWLSALGYPHSCPGLDTLIVCWSTVGPNINPFFSSIALPSLRTLEIDFDSGFVMTDSDYDDCSDLYDLDDSGHITDNQSQMVSITMSRFFGRSSTHLNTLALIGIPFPPSELAECLALAPSLISLEIQFDDWHPIDNEFLLTLRTNLPGYILPCLRSLSLRGRSKFSEEILDAVVASRRDIDPANDGVALLENLTLGCTVLKSQSTSRLPRFHRFVAGGLNITYGKGWSVYNFIQMDMEQA